MEPMRHMATVVLGVASLAASTFLPGAAGANGGPVEDADVRGKGDVAPIDDPHIRLVSETLLLTLHGGGFRADAEYVLSNRGAPREVMLGIPTGWDREHFEYGTEALDIATAGGREVKIRIGGKSHSCVPTPSKDRELRGDPDSPPARVNVWCVARVKVPSGDAIPLSLQYVGHGFGDANALYVEYVLAPAGYWRGPAEHVRIAIDGRGAKVNLLWPPGGRVDEGGIIRWEGRDVDLKTLGAVVLDHRKERGWDGGWMRRAVQYSIAASSELAPEGKRDYKAANATDHDVRTAWCEGVEGSGIGQSLAVTLRSESLVQAGETCAVKDIVFNPGYGRDEKAFAANGKVKAARIEDCAEPAVGFDVDLGFPDSVSDPSKTSVKNAAFRVAVPKDAFHGVPGCIRMVIKDVETGKYADTCVSEFVPRVFCKAQ